MSGPHPALLEAETIVEVLDAAAAARPDMVAVADGTLELTTVALQKRARRAAASLVAAGVAPGDRVALWGPNSAEWAIAHLAILAAGATVVPLNTRGTQAEVGDISERARASLVIAVDEFLGSRLHG